MKDDFMSEFEDFLNRKSDGGDGETMFDRESLLEAKAKFNNDDTIELWADLTMQLVRKIHDTAKLNGFTEEQAFEFTKFMFVTVVSGGV